MVSKRGWLDGARPPDVFGQTVPFGKEESVRKQSSLVKPGDIPEPFEMKRRAEMPEYRTQVANTVNRTSNVSIKGNDRTVSAPGTAMDKNRFLLIQHFREELSLWRNRQYVSKRFIRQKILLQKSEGEAFRRNNKRQKYT